MATGSISPKHSINGKVTTGGGTTDHSRLYNRDAADQHPISAITDLQTILDSKLDSETALPLIEEAIKYKAKGLYYDTAKELATKSYWYLTSEIDSKTKQGTKASIISGPYDLGAGGGGGGGGITTVTIKQVNWPSTVVENATTYITVNWSSVKDEEPTGNGTIYLSVNGTQVKVFSNQAQGLITLDISDYIISGDNTVQVKVIDSYGTSSLTVGSIAAVSLTLTSNFNYKLAYPLAGTTGINYTYIPTGNVEKTVYFIVDDKEYGKQVVKSTAEQQTFFIGDLSHGEHTLTVYFTAVINGEIVTSNQLFYALIYHVAGDETPIIASEFNKLEQEQYISFSIPYRIYVENKNLFDVDLLVNGEIYQSLHDVDSTEHYWEYENDIAGTYDLSIKCGTTVKTFSVHIAESSIDIRPVTQNLALALNTLGRSNSEPEDIRSKWINTVTGESCTLTNFNWRSDGWIQDDNGNTVLRISGDARVTIPYKPFELDCKTTGKTIEIEFATSTISDYSSIIMSCFSSDLRGFYLTPQIALIKSQQSELSTQYKEDELVRVSFVIEKNTDNRIIWMYINGIASGACRYSTTDDFAQLYPEQISIGSNDATIDIYNIRIYDNNLTSRQVVNNWIADTQISSLKVQRYVRNNNYDEKDKLVISKLPSELPYIIWDIDALPTYKGNKILGDVRYVEPLDTSRNFTSTDATYNVQGTSSAGYPTKNIRIKYKVNTDYPSSNFQWYDDNGDPITKFTITKNGIGDNYFTYKVDFASSEGANNVELTKLYNDVSLAYGIVTPPQNLNTKIRVGIDGYPIVAFQKDASGNVNFISKANFNNDKANEAVYGFASGDESWEITNNSSNLAKFKVAVTQDNFADAFEIRYPDKDGYSNLEKLMPMSAWVVSTNPDAATGEQLPEKVTYTYTEIIAAEDGSYSEVTTTKEFEYDTAEYRLTKFKAELKDHFNVNSTIFYYIFTHLFLMVDSRAKNMFPTYFASRTEGDGGDRWFWLPYDMDTALGINNEGKLTFDYGLEDIDKVNDSDVFNGQDSVMWNNVRKIFSGEILKMYSDLRSRGLLSYNLVENKFESHQGQWSENIFNEDAKNKYVTPLAAGDNYLEMLLGSKAEQRKWWLYNRFKYIDSKYTAGDTKNDRITIRAYLEEGSDKPNMVITPYADIYVTVSFANSENKIIKKRAERNVPIIIENPFTKEEKFTDQESYIYSASQLKSVGDLSAFYPDTVKIGSATRLQGLKVGDSAESYRNTHLTLLELGNNILLKYLDVRNCVNLTQSIDVSQCVNIEEIYCDNTRIQGITLPDGGILKTLYLPETLTNLTIKNQPLLTDFKLAGTSNLSSLCLENIPSSSIDVDSLVFNLPANAKLRLIGISKTYSSYAEVKKLYDKFDELKGLDSTGIEVDKAQVTGTIIITSSIKYSEYAELLLRYSEIKIIPIHIICTVNFWKYEDVAGSEQFELLSTSNVISGNRVEVIPEPPERVSSISTVFTFKNWYINVGSQKQLFDPSIETVKEDLNIYPDYTETVRQYTVTFDKHTGIESIQVYPEQIVLDYGSAVARPSVTGIPEGLELIDWHTSDNYTAWKFADEETPNLVTGDTTLIAHWNDSIGPEINITQLTCNKYRATCTDNVGITGYAITHTSEEPKAEEWIEINPPQLIFTTEQYITTSEDYYFWAKDSISTYSRVSSVLIRGVEIERDLGTGVSKIDILYKNSEGEYEIVDTSAVFKDSIIKINGELDSHYENLILTMNDSKIDSDKEYTISQNIIIKGTCTPKVYRVIFNTAGKGIAPEPQDIVYNNKITKPDPQYDEGYVINSWFTTEGYDPGTEWNFDTDLIQNTMTLYGKWESVEKDSTKISVTIPSDNYELTVNYTQSSYSGVIVSWGDGESSCESEIAGLTALVSLTHTYKESGNFTLEFSCDTGTYLLGYSLEKAVIMPASVITAVTFFWDVPYTNPFAFNEASNLQEVKLTSYMGKVAEGCFYKCSGLKSVSFADNIYEIEKDAFHGCTKLIGNIKLPVKLQKIGSSAFRECQKVTRFIIPDSVKSIGDYAFYNCEALTEFSFPENLTSIEGYMLCACSSLTTLDIPEHITTLKSSCFAADYALEKIILRNKDLQIGSLCFNDCTLLKTAGPIGSDCNIEFAWDSEIPDNAFSSGWTQSYLISIILPDTIKSIGTSAFKYCTRLESINNSDETVSLANLPVGLLYIGDEAFHSCNKLKNLYIPYTVEYIGSCAFRNCAGLTLVNIYTSSVVEKSKPTDIKNSWFLYSGLYSVESQGSGLHIPKILSDSSLVENAYGKYWNYYDITGIILKYIADL